MILQSIDPWYIKWINQNLNMNSSHIPKCNYAPNPNSNYNSNPNFDPILYLNCNLNIDYDPNTNPY